MTVSPSRPLLTPAIKKSYCPGELIIMDAVRRGTRPKLLRQVAVDELLTRGKTLVRADGKLYCVECREVSGELGR